MSGHERMLRRSIVGWASCCEAQSRRALALRDQHRLYLSRDWSRLASVSSDRAFALARELAVVRS